MTTEYRVGGTLLSNRVRLITGVDGLPAAAFRGEVAMGGVRFDDPTGNLTITGWQTFTVDETDATPTRVWTGYIAEHDRGRGDVGRTGSSRIHDCDIIDLNTLLQLHVIRGNAAKRGAESDVARVTWLLTSTGLSGIVFDEGLVSSLNPINFLASDLRRKFPNAALAEMAPVASKNFFVYYDTTAARPALFWDRDTATVWAAGIKLSNVAADVDNNLVFAPHPKNTTVEGQPANRYGGISYGWKGEPIYAQSAATITAMGLLRDAVYDTDRVGLQATAEAQVVQYLNTHANEADVIRTQVRLPSSHVNKVFAGQELDIKLAHVAGYTGYVTTRIRRANKRPVALAMWDVDLELWVPPTAASDGAVSTCPAIVQTASTRLDVEGDTVTFGVAPTAGHLLLAWVSRRANSVGLKAGWSYLGAEVTDTGTDAGRWQYGFADGSASYVFLSGSGFSKADITVYDISGADSFVPADATVYLTDDAASSTSHPLSAVTAPTTGEVILAGWVQKTDLDGAQPATMGSGMVKDFNDGNNDSFADQSPWHLAAHWDGTTTPLTPSCTIPNAHPYGGVVVQIHCNAESLPFAGDPVSETPGGTIDGVNDDFTTAGPWLPGTLRVLHDGFDQTSHITTSDPAAGTFTLDYAPSPGSTLEAVYESA